MRSLKRFFGFLFCLISSSLLLVFGLCVNEEGGLFLAARIARFKQLETKETAIAFPYYHHRRSQFELLPIHASDIVFLGDSITDEGEWAELCNNPVIKNRGIASDTTIGVLNRLHEIITPQPQKIFLMIGVNDLANLSRSPIEIIQTYKEILTQVRERSPQTSVFIQSVLPINQKLFLGCVTNSSIRALNDQLQPLAIAFSYAYIDLHSHFSDAQHQLDVKYTLDGIHLNGMAYRHWQALIEPYLRS